MAMPPEAVAEFMRRRAAQSEREAYHDPVDEDTEKALRTRGDTLIDLSLAHYGRHMEVVSELFLSSAPDSPIRLACLANRSQGLDTFRSFPTDLLGRRRGSSPMAAWLLSASDRELCALFENPTLTDSFLSDLLERRRGWECIDDDTLCRIVSVLDRNPRMRTLRDSGYMDGYAEYIYSSVFNAAWKLAETAPVTEEWAFSLGWLYERLVPDAFSIKEPLALAARWHIPPDDVNASERQAKDHDIGLLDNMERVRKGLARLALCHNSGLLASLLASDDIAFRAAAYAVGALDAKQLRAGWEKDGELMHGVAVDNMHLWRTQATRQALESVTWGAVNNSKRPGAAASAYNQKERDVRKQHPEWFVDEVSPQAMDEDGADDQQPSTKVDVFTLSAQLDHNTNRLDAIAKTLQALAGRTSWIWWFSLGALVASVLHF